jgi:YHS domain-containing protein
MNFKYWLLLGAVSASLLAGCSKGPETSPGTASAAPKVTFAYAQGSIKKGDKAHCVVCVVKEGSTEEEPVAETLDYKGKTYAFCNEKEKAEFISEPARFAAP